MKPNQVKGKYLGDLRGFEQISSAHFGYWPFACSLFIDVAFDNMFLHAFSLSIMYQRKYQYRFKRQLFPKIFLFRKMLFLEQLKEENMNLALQDNAGRSQVSQHIHINWGAWKHEEGRSVVGMY